MSFRFHVTRNFMFLTVHSTAGALIGDSIGNPFLAFLFGMASHFLLDRIPHFDPNGYQDFETRPVRLTRAGKKYITIVLIDTLFVGVLLLVLFKKQQHPYPAMFGALGAVAPDYLMGLAKLTKNKWLLIYDGFHLKMHFDPKKIPVTFITGNLTQVAVLFIALFLLFR